MLSGREITPSGLNNNMILQYSAILAEEEAPLNLINRERITPWNEIIHVPNKEGQLLGTQ